MTIKRNGEIWVTDEIEKFDLDIITSLLQNQTYWAQKRSREVIAKSIQNSSSFGLFKGETQIGFARVIGDQATFSYLCDVVIDEKFREQGLGKFFMEFVLNSPKFVGCKWLLKTADAHRFYRAFGFKDLETTAGWMTWTSKENNFCDDVPVKPR